MLISISSLTGLWQLGYSYSTNISSQTGLSRWDYDIGSKQYAFIMKSRQGRYV